MMYFQLQPAFRQRAFWVSKFLLCLVAISLNGFAQEPEEEDLTKRTLESAQTASMSQTPEAEAAFMERATHNLDSEVPETSLDDSENNEISELHHRSIEVKGFGFWVNRMLKKAIWITLPPKGRRPERLNRNFVEDSVGILEDELESMGYLDVQTDLEIIFETEAPSHYRNIDSAGFQISEMAPIQKIIFRIESGPRYFLDEIQFTGLTAIEREEAATYFRGPEFLIRLKSNRIYSPDQLQQSLIQLERALHELGFAEATAKSTITSIESNSGKVGVEIQVNEGPLYLVRSTQHKIIRAGSAEPEVERVFHQKTRFSETWVMDWLQSLREREYVQGFAEAQTRVITSNSEPAKSTATDSADTVLEDTYPVVYVDIEAETRSGERFVLGDTQIEGANKTKEKFLRKKIQLDPGIPLNPLSVQDARYRLARTGLFDSVRYSFEDPVDETQPPTRNVTYHLQESKTTEVNLLAGYGSFELLRGGVEWERRNLFGIAHSSRLRLVQAIRASRINYDYTAPGLFHSPVDGFFSLYARQRDEAAFQRRESGGGIGTEFPLDRIQSRMGVRYNMEYLNAEKIETASPLGSRSSRVASVSINWLHD